MNRRRVAGISIICAVFLSLGMFLLLVAAGYRPALDALGIYSVRLRAEPAEGEAPSQQCCLLPTYTAGPITCRVCIARNMNGILAMADRMVIGFCPSWSLDSSMDRHFEYKHVYEEPGIYQATFFYGPLESETIQIEAR